MTDEIADRVAACFRTVFPYLGDEEIRAAAKNDLGDWDSLAAISLATVVEEEFGVQFDDDELDAMTSFTAVCDGVSAHVGT